MHPMLNEGVSIGTFYYKGSDQVHYYVENAEGREFEISRRLSKALLAADGTKPLALPDRGRSVLADLKKHGIVHTSRFVSGDGLINRFILFPISAAPKKNRPLCRAFSALLPIVSLLLFAVAVGIMWFGQVETGYDFNLWLYNALILFSLAMHEVGHLVTGLAFGYAISDTGVLLLGFLPIGAYVAHDEKKDATRNEKIRFSLAGIQINLLLAALFLFAAILYFPLSFTFTFVANINVALAITNLLPAAGLDGEAALSALWGVESINKVAKNALFHRKQRRRLLRSGLPGYACLGIFSFICLSNILVWSLLGLEMIWMCLGLF